MDDFPACFVFAHEALVELAVEVVEFALQLAVVFEAGGVDGGVGQGAAGFAGVGAVAEATGLGELLDVAEAGLEAVRCGPELDFAEAGHVDEEPAGGHEEHASGGGGMAAVPVVFSDCSGGLQSAAEESVEEGGFADAGGADEGSGFAVGH